MRLLKNLFALAAGLALSSGALAQTISFTGTTLNQNFDGMGALGTNTPTGWFVGSNAATVINYTTVVTVSAGANVPAGGVRGFNLGTSNATERALGTGATGVNRYMEARIRNNSIFGIDSITVGYDGEQWRIGNNSLATNANLLVLQYSTDGTNYVDMGAGFNFTQLQDAPITTALDGNAAANRTAGRGGLYTPGSVVQPGSTIFLRWFDMNELQTDPVLAIDDFSFSATLISVPVTITITSPTNGQIFPETADIPVTTTTSGSISNVAFFVDGTFVSTDNSTPFAGTIPTALLPLGSHTITALATNTMGAMEAFATVSIDVVPNQPPTITINNGVTEVLVGTAITNLATITDDAGVTNVDWFVDGAFRFRRATNTAPFTFINADSLAGTHTFQATVTDRGGLTGSSAILTVTVTNPPSNFSLLVTNGSDWKYFANTTEPPVDGGSLIWSQVGYDDSAWLNGFAELGDGDAANGYPETTLIDIGTGTARYRTIYFRKTFQSGDPLDFGGVVLRLLRDDGAVVHINGQAVWTNNIVVTTSPIVYTNLAGASGDENTYLISNISPDFLVVGENTVAVEVHQQNATSSDLGFDLMIWGEVPTAPMVAIGTPTNGQSFIETSLVTVNVNASTFVTNITLFVDGTPVGDDGIRPFSIVASNLSVGSHQLVARGVDQFTATGDSAPVTIFITANQPPVVAITNTFNGSNYSLTLLVGQVITNQLLVSDDLGLTNVDFFVDGVLHLRKAATFGQILVNDALAGVHSLQAVATDRLGLSAASAIVMVTVTNPPLALLVTNASLWKYENSSNDLGTAWRAFAFDDSGWLNSGLGDLGGGSVNENNPERTAIDIGPTGARIPTIYFRHAFTVASLSGYTNLVLNVLRDDGAAVYLNGNQILRNNLGAAATFASFASATAADDGTVYLRANVSPTNLMSGLNVLAVEVHNSSATSSDLTFDLMLWAEGGSGGPVLSIVNNDPIVSITWPGPGYNLQQSSDIGSPANWTDVPGNPQNAYATPLPLPPASLFFRLAPTP